MFGSKRRDRSKGKGKITQEKPDNSGTVNLLIKIKRLDRTERKVTIAIVERDTSKTVFKSSFRDEQSGSNESARKKGEDVAKLYCENNDYIIKDKMSNLNEPKPIVRTVDKRMR